MSVDANKWVLSYTTPVVSGGKTAGILHFEHGLEVFQHVLNREMGQTGQYILAVEDSGWIVSDSRGEIAIAKQGESEDHSNYFKKFSLGGLDIQALKKKVGSGDKGTGKVSEGGTDVDVSYKVIGTWTIVVVGNA